MGNEEERGTKSRGVENRGIKPTKQKVRSKKQLSGKGKKGRKKAEKSPDLDIPAERGKIFEWMVIEEWLPELKREGFTEFFAKPVRDKKLPRGTQKYQGWQKNVFRSEPRGPDLIAIDKSKKIILVGDVTKDPASPAEIKLGGIKKLPHGTGGEEEMRHHFEKTIEDAEQLARYLPEEFKDYEVVAQDRYSESDVKQSRRISVYKKGRLTRPSATQTVKTKPAKKSESKRKVEPKKEKPKPTKQPTKAKNRPVEKNHTNSEESRSTTNSRPKQADRATTKKEQGITTKADPLSSKTIKPDQVRIKTARSRNRFSVVEPATAQSLGDLFQILYSWQLSNLDEAAWNRAEDDFEKQRFKIESLRERGYWVAVTVCLDEMESIDIFGMDPAYPIYAGLYVESGLTAEAALNPIPTIRDTRADAESSSSNFSPGPPAKGRVRNAYPVLFEPYKADSSPTVTPKKEWRYVNGVYRVEKVVKWEGENEENKTLVTNRRLGIEIDFKNLTKISIICCSDLYTIYQFYQTRSATLDFDRAIIRAEFFLQSSYFFINSTFDLKAFRDYRIKEDFTSGNTVRAEDERGVVIWTPA